MCSVPNIVLIFSNISFLSAVEFLSVRILMYFTNSLKSLFGILPFTRFKKDLTSFLVSVIDLFGFLELLLEVLT